MRTLFATVVCLLVGSRGKAAVQTSPAAFDVASIKPSAVDARGTSMRMPPGGRVEIGNMTLKEMIENAYNIQSFQIAGGPSWMASVRYDISAKAGTVLKREEILLMLQSLLTDRFQLVFRRDVRELPVYALVLARKDGKLGPGLIESKEGRCAQADPANPLAADPMRSCGDWELDPGRLTTVSVPIATLAPLLSGLMGRTVLDKTGLTKHFDINIEWTPDETQARQLPPNAPPRDPGGPSIFTVFRDQLGISLQAQKSPVETFVIEGAEKPSEN